MSKPYSLSISEAASDPKWDDFLIATEGGRHEQTSLWAQVKALDGWRPVRCVVREAGDMVGGFQVLWRTKARLLRIGYASHGPIAAGDDADLCSLLRAQMEVVARMFHLHMLLAQPAAGGAETASWQLDRPKWIPNNLYPVVETTGEIDLSLDDDAILGRMRGSRRRELRKSLDSSLTFTEGGREDLGTFFSLMCMTCDRQHNPPNPPSLDAVLTIWDLFHPRGLIHVFLVHHDKDPVAAFLVISFGTRVLLWKIGWSGARREQYPNHFLYWQVMMWARKAGYGYADFGSIGKGNKARSPGKAAANGPSYYKYGFGPEIVSLPRSRIYVPNRVLRMGCRLAGAAKVGHRMRMARRQDQIR